MKNKSTLLTLIAVSIITSTLIHALTAEVSIFHGMILHPSFMLLGISIFAVLEKIESKEKV